MAISFPLSLPSPCLLCLLFYIYLLSVFHELGISIDAQKSLENKIRIRVLHGLILVLKKKKHLIIVEKKKDILDKWNITSKSTKLKLKCIFPYYLFRLFRNYFSDLHIFICIFHESIVYVTVCMCVFHFKMKIHMELSSPEHHVFFKVKKKSCCLKRWSVKCRKGNSMENET